MQKSQTGGSWIWKYSYCHMLECNYSYRWVLYWWQNLLHTLIPHVTTLYSSLLHTCTHARTHYCSQSHLRCYCLVVASTAGVSLPFGSQTVPRLCYQLITVTANSNGISEVFWLQMLTGRAYNISALGHVEIISSFTAILSSPGKHACLKSLELAVTVV
jgi:hypothetical protein